MGRIGRGHFRVVAIRAVHRMVTTRALLPLGRQVVEERWKSLVGPSRQQQISSRKGGRVVEGSGLENRQGVYAPSWVRIPPLPPNVRSNVLIQLQFAHRGPRLVLRYFQG